MAAPTLQRRPLVKQILSGADDDLLVIAGLGSPNWDITEAGDRPLNMPLWGAMGAPVSMGLGLAIAQPKKRVLVITGDADMMMSIGSLATVASQQPDNLAICVLDNEKFGETGNQASHTSPRNNGPTDSGAGTDISIIAKGCGIADSALVREAGEVAQLVSADDDEARRAAAVRHRDSCRRRSGDRAGDAGDHLDRDARLGARLGEALAFGQEAIAGVDTVRARLLGGEQDQLGLEVAFRGRCRPQAHRLVRHQHVGGARVGIGINRDRLDPHALRGAEHAAGDLTAIGDQDFLEHARSSIVSAWG